MKKARLPQKGGKKFWYAITSGFPGGAAVENLHANVGDMGSVPRSGRSSGGGNDDHSSILARETQGQRRIKEPGRLQPMGLQKSWM